MRQGMTWTPTLGRLAPTGVGGISTGTRSIMDPVDPRAPLIAQRTRLASIAREVNTGNLTPTLKSLALSRIAQIKRVVDATALRPGIPFRTPGYKLPLRQPIPGIPSGGGYDPGWAYPTPKPGPVPLPTPTPIPGPIPPSPGMTPGIMPGGPDIWERLKDWLEEQRRRATADTPSTPSQPVQASLLPGISNQMLALAVGVGVVTVALTRKKESNSK